MTTHTAPSGHTSLPVPGDLFARHQTITGLRALADFLEANPAVPVDEYGQHFHVFIRLSEDASTALVDQTAALMGVEVTDDRQRGGHYFAERTFGRITYSIVHIPERHRRESHARRSYDSNIVPDPDADMDRSIDRDRYGGFA
ncbi:hypothetical protein ACIBI3_33020 [Actinomadura luteofluorescens]|uniref:hypothetical protein n=1 Tax=Actinomadura luteofluorescens TaxID=46163 RepID=UPI00347B126D